MSSHHIVKDKQEPALIIANGESCSTDLLNQLLEWSPYVMVLDGAIQRVLNLQIKIDAFLGDFDSSTVSFENIKKIQFPIEIIETPNQDKTDLEKAIDLLIEKGFSAANIIWATGRRADHTFANIALLVRYTNLIKLKIIDDYSSVFSIPKLPFVFNKWYSKNTPISLIPIAETSGITTSNLKYPLCNDSLSLDSRIGNSNYVLSDGVVQISFEAGCLLIMECND